MVLRAPAGGMAHEERCNEVGRCSPLQIRTVPAFSFIESDAPDMRTLRADDAGQALAAEFFLGGFSADPTNPTPRSSR